MDKKKKFGNASSFAGFANHSSTTIEELLEQSYDMVAYEKTEKNFEFNVVEDGMQALVKAFDKGHALDRYGKPKVVKPKFPLSVLRDLAMTNTDLSAGVDAYGVNAGEMPWGLRLREDIVEETNEQGNVVRYWADSEQPVTDQEYAVIQLQKKQVKSFVENLCHTMTFIDLRGATVRDQEEIGNDFWEAIRAADGSVYVRPIKDDTTIRVCEDDETPVEYYEHKYFEGHEIKSMRVAHYFKRFVQYNKGKKRYYKSFGDKRYLCRFSGVYFDPTNVPEKSQPATEMIHHKLRGIDYGLPRWVPAIYDVQTSKSAALTNRETMNNSGIPRLLGVLTNSTDNNIEQKFRRIMTQLKKSKNKDSFVMLRLKPEEVGVGDGASVAAQKFDIHELGGSQSTEGMYLDLQRFNKENINATQRLPDLIYGRTSSNLNRATAFILQSNTERQVFAPLRRKFDAFMNNVLFIDQGFNYWEFYSQSPDLDDQELLISALALLIRGGAVTPNDLRKLAPKFIGQELPAIEAEWADTPITVKPDAMNLEDEPLTKFAFEVLKEKIEGTLNDGGKIYKADKCC